MLRSDLGLARRPKTEGSRCWEYCLPSFGKHLLVEQNMPFNHTIAFEKSALLVCGQLRSAMPGVTGSFDNVS